MLRLLSGCVLLLALAAITPQDALDLRARYGEPDVERFTIRPDVTMTAEYGPDGKACELIIEPRQHLLRQPATPGPTMGREAAMDILNEVVPEMRGHDFSADVGMSMGSGCAGYQLMLQKDTSVGLVVDSCQGPNRVQRLDVQFNRDACAQWHPALPPKAAQK